MEVLQTKRYMQQTRVYFRISVRPVNNSIAEEVGASGHVVGHLHPYGQCTAYLPRRSTRVLASVT